MLKLWGSSALICLSSKEDIHIHIYTKQNFLYAFAVHFSEPELLRKHLAPERGMFSPFYFTTSLPFIFHASFNWWTVPRSIMCACPCKLFPDVFILLALKIEGMALLFFNFLCHFLSLSRYCFFYLFEKRMKCKISLKKKALQTPRKWTIFVGHCDILWSAVFSSFLIFFLQTCL